MLSPDQIAKRGEEIYQEKLKSKYEPENNGKFLAIEIESEEDFLGETLDEAFEKTKIKYPGRLFHFIKIGFPSVYTLSHRISLVEKHGWLF